MCAADVGLVMLGLCCLLCFELRCKLPITGIVNCFAPYLSSGLFLSVLLLPFINMLCVIKARGSHCCDASIGQIMCSRNMAYYIGNTEL